MTGRSKRLVLFDIDGTLITTNGMARKHFANAIERVFNRKTNAHRHDFAGKLDTQIYREILEDAGMAGDEIWEHFEHFKNDFYSNLAPDLNAETVTTLPGTNLLLEALLEDNDIILALLTGNLEQGARLKLNVVDYNRFFPFGAFGDDGHSRADLPPIAVQRAENYSNIEIESGNVIIVGDTPNDISCGKNINATSIAVATGKFNYEILEEHSPNYLFHSLEETDEVLRAIYND